MITLLSAGVYLVMHEGQAHEVHVSEGGLCIDGHQMPFERDDPRAWKGAGQSAGTKGSVSIKAPMPGKIIRLLVEVGDAVEAGQGMLLMEAMKMQNELKSPKAGRVAALNVRAQDSVTAGMVLAVVD